jgi:hypothetical protein
VIVSEAAAASAGLEGEGVENRSLELKGISQPVPVRVMRVMPTSGFHHRDAENIER